MRFPVSSTTFYHYLGLADLETRPFPNPLSPATPSTVIDLEGETVYVEKPADLPAIFREVEQAWNEAPRTGARSSRPCRRPSQPRRRPRGKSGMR